MSFYSPVAQFNYKPVICGRQWFAVISAIPAAGTPKSCYELAVTVKNRYFCIRNKREIRYMPHIVFTIVVRGQVYRIIQYIKCRGKQSTVVFIINVDFIFTGAKA